MNVMWYVGKFDEATWQLFTRLGVTPDYLRRENRGMAAVQQNISYKRELRAGDVISVHSRVVEIREKVIRFVHEMIDNSMNEIAATTELTVVHMDTIARRSCPFPEAIVAQGRRAIPDAEGQAERKP
jgi:acyl-CoA thioester hydrolase